jgi:hypothetical protein
MTEVMVVPRPRFYIRFDRRSVVTIDVETKTLGRAVRLERDQ